VCPNLALYQYSVEPVKLDLQKIESIDSKSMIINDHPFEIKQAPQILHIADWCNECGNCNTFCPTADAPYKVKPHLYLSKEAFDSDDDCYFYEQSTQTLIDKLNGDIHQLSEINKEINYSINKSEVLIDKKTLKVKSFNLQNDESIALEKVAEMKIIFQGAQEILSKSKTGKNSPFGKGAGGIRPSAGNPKSINERLKKTKKTRPSSGRYIPYNKDLKQYSRNLRNESTLSEILLWNELKSKKLGYTFNRQKPLLNYIVDFYCKPLNLVIEIDGSVHYTDEARKRDKIRQDKLKEYSLIFVRFDNSKVKKDIENVVQIIKDKIVELEKGGSS
ncbi:MAG: DUF559 domain-containing protein, partial [Bacteroidales bacterium]|nr:DUF559 domain-containing protein [Bacteroidales bacterium]